MILTGPAIREAMQAGDVQIDPFEPGMIQPNGVDLHMGEELIAFEDGAFDIRRAPEHGTTHHLSADEGYVLQPGALYLIATRETVASTRYAQWLFGDRSCGSMGLWVQVSAPLGHTGSRIRWTLELRVVKPLRIYAGMRCCKVCFLTNAGDIQLYGSEHFIGGKYLENRVTVSRLALDSTSSDDEGA